MTHVEHLEFCGAVAPIEYMRGISGDIGPNAPLHYCKPRRARLWNNGFGTGPTTQNAPAPVNNIRWIEYAQRLRAHVTLCVFGILYVVIVPHPLYSIRKYPFVSDRIWVQYRRQAEGNKPHYPCCRES